MLASRVVKKFCIQVVFRKLRPRSVIPESRLSHFCIPCLLSFPNQEARKAVGPRVQW